MQGARSLTHINGARDWIRWVVEGGSRTVGDMRDVSHAERMRLTQLGNPAAAGRRGRRPLRAGGEPSLRHETQQLRKAIPKRPAHLTAPLNPATRTPRRGRRPRRPLP